MNESEITTDDDQFECTDDIRTSNELRYLQKVVFDEPLNLEKGGVLSQVEVAFETYGTLNERRDNAILVCHALSGDSHVARHEEEDDPGWWDTLIGPGKAIDTNRYFVICPNILGGCRGTTGPESINLDTGEPYGADFPLITIADIVTVQRRLIDHLGIRQLLAVIGGSVGGYMTLDWATRFPDRLAGAMAIATSAHLTAQALAFDVVGRNAILNDPEYHGGEYAKKETAPLVGLAIARMLGHITYLSLESMTQKFHADKLQPRQVQSQFETKFSVGSYLAYQGDKFVERFDANSYVTLTMALDLFELGSTPEKLAATFSRSQCRWLILGFSSDWLFPPFQLQEMVNAIVATDRPVSYCCLESDAGHDAFLLQDKRGIYEETVRGFLANLRSTEKPEKSEVDGAAEMPMTSIFKHRLDYDTIVNLIPPESSVLDLGSGNGELLARLRRRGHKRLVGIELDQSALMAGVRRGLDMIHADLNRGLSTFYDKQFDFVVLSRTLQTIMDVEKILQEMLRVGNRCIVSFPNVGYRPLREQLMQGRAPRGDATQGFQWYNTPNVRFLTIADFEEFCKEKDFPIHEQIAFDTMRDCRVTESPNLNADLAIVVLGRE